MTTQQIDQTKRKIRILLVLVIIGLVLSGVTAFPLESELAFLDNVAHTVLPAPMTTWINTIYTGVKETNAQYPFIAYGTDWLAFAHLVIAIVFIGPLRDPVRNIWVIEFGLIACAAIFPLALVAGHVRDIPVFWRLLDCSFGVGGAILLWPCRRLAARLDFKPA